MLITVSKNAGGVDDISLVDKKDQEILPQTINFKTCYNSTQTNTTRSASIVIQKQPSTVYPPSNHSTLQLEDKPILAKSHWKVPTGPRTPLYNRSKTTFVGHLPSEQIKQADFSSQKPVKGPRCI